MGLNMETENKESVGMAFTFDTAQKISDKEAFEFFLGGDCYHHDLYYPPRYNLDLLNDATYAATLHESSLDVKAKIITSIFKKNEFLSAINFNKFIIDYLKYGDGYLYNVRSKMGNILRLEPLMTHYMRRGRGGGFYFVRPNEYDNPQKFDNREISLFSNYDTVQNISGRPSYLAALPSIMLNKEATFFRIKYYRNGSHAGFILSINGKIDPKLMESIRENLQKTKGDGNFRNLVLNIPEGNDKSVQLIPISEVAAKDEFFNVKRITDEDINTSHRMPPTMMGITPKNAGGFGDPAKYAAVFYQNEILPLQVLLDDFNDQLGVPAFQFKKYEIID